MFTGLIEEVGKVKKVQQLGGGLKISISSITILNDLNIGDSININGACQTVVNFNKESFDVEAVEETLKKTNLAKLKLNNNVNLERSLTLNKKLGGHFVLGHVDTTGKILTIKKLSTSYLVSVSCQKEYLQYLINVGSIAVEGISLTVANYNKNSFTVSIIPHTWKHTNLADKKIGEDVNLEFDVLGKYVARILSNGKKEKLTVDWLQELGY
ncbi:MAG: riboflavin synthase [Ignavibacteriales bacterium]|nr:riboflavin synthase [Ignavibacteriales bacterium]